MSDDNSLSEEGKVKPEDLNIKDHEGRIRQVEKKHSLILGVAPIVWAFLIIIVTLFWIYLNFRFDTLDNKIDTEVKHLHEIINLKASSIPFTICKLFGNNALHINKK